ncbi:CRISPR-associated endonuclease Cas2 [Microcoleus sp. FACHB-1515]|uniref:CRISPR-associated endonuclease Cas2 n=1 Tax=Cyanophyceae TaxID=3028117 RepID=UPI0016821CFD|nr:CRISPR-associated endonuclease Cas2 [Microcoleus sp. FACHB-1515]MBD2090630.1 CRISPR-associated endonuclease Cas2 [Microcoleus sp. FACHB-1515]
MSAFYLVCYDVVGDRRRNKIAHLLEGYGMRVQQSVFECVLTTDQLEFVQKRLLKILKSQEDQVRFYPLSAHCRRKVMILGTQPERQVDDAAFIV